MDRKGERTKITTMHHLKKCRNYTEKKNFIQKNHSLTLWAIHLVGNHHKWELFTISYIRLRVLGVKEVITTGEHAHRS